MEQPIPHPKSLSETQFVPHEKVLRWCVIGVLFIASLAIRFYHIDDPPLDFHPIRQYRSAIIARGYYRASDETIPDWQREVAIANMERLGIIEPPIMEHLATLGYRLAGGEHLWIPLALSATFWVIGGVFLFLLTQQVFSTDAALIASGFYLLFPYGYAASRSFQPDPMMIMMMLAGLYAITSHHQKPTLVRAIVAAIVSSAALLIKPVVVFVIFGAYASLAIRRRGFRGAIFDLQALIFVVVSLLPAAVYYGNGVFIAGFLARQPQDKFIPSLWLSPSYWGGWMLQIRKTMGYTAIIGALIGLLLTRSRTSRILLAGLWLAYFTYGLVFNYHIHTHCYYQLPLAPIVGLSISPVGVEVLRQLRQTRSRPLWRSLFLINIIVITALFRVQEYRWGVRFYWPVDPDIVTIAPEIGEQVEHSLNTVFLTEANGYPLRYYGDLGGASWPSGGDYYYASLQGRQIPDVEEYMDSRATPPEFFIITDFDEFERQADLADYLFANYPALAQTSEYLIFDLRGRIDP